MSNNEDDNSSMNSEATRSALSGATGELFKIWAAEILQGDERSPKQKSLPQEARGFFTSLSHKTSISIGTTQLKTLGSSNAALAQLVQALGDCLAASRHAEVLSCLIGALKGCRNVSDKVVQLLCTFFIEYIGPLEPAIRGDDDEDGDKEDTIRDLALEATELALRLNERPIDAQLSMARTSVERRCATLEDYGLDSNKGLSLLPRSRRSLCFTTLQTAVNSVETVKDDAFVLFCIRCLYGESDPRCLLQLLDLLSSVRAKASSINDESILEAVSPYYPIQFTPPPNDIHGITRERLKSAVNRILVQVSSMHLFLELLEPDVSYSEQLEAMWDLGEYLKQNALHLKVSEMEELSDCLRRVHSNASTANGKEAKSLAETVRVVAGTTAATVEQDEALWNAFVQTPILRFDITNTMNAAYLASLAARGGEQTLRLCLNTALPVVSDFYTIAALCSACRAAMDRIPMHPHPLEEYGSKVLSIICDSLESEITVSALTAFEAATMAVPSHGLSNAWFERISAILLSLSDFSVGINSEEVRVGCSSVMGRMLTKALEENKNATSVLDSEPIRTLLRDEIFPRLIDSVQKATQEGHHARMTLSYVTGLEATSKIMQLLVFALHSAIRDIDEHRRQGVTAALTSLFKHDAASYAFQQLQPPNSTLFDIISELIPERLRNASANMQVASLSLPATIDEVDIVRREISCDVGIIACIRTAYESVLDESHAQSLVAAIDLVLPPLNSADVVKLSMLLPLLSALMECDSVSHDALAPYFRNMINSLFEASVSNDIIGEAKEHAARCLHAAISKFTPRNAQTCAAKELVVSNVMPIVTMLFQEIRNSNVRHQKDNKEKYLQQFEDQVKMLALLGSAAAIRGGPSSKTSDAVTHFLLDLAAKRPTDAIFIEMTEVIDLSVFGAYGPQLVEETSLISAHYFGSLLVSGPPGKAIWKQRLLHMSAKYLLPHAPFSQGSLTAVCYVICAADVKRIDASSIETFVKAILDGLPSEQHPQDCKRLQLSAMLKLVASRPEIMEPHAFALATGLLRIYASADIASRFLALRVLDRLSRDNQTSSVRPAVVAILQKALDHPSRVLRSAAAEVRNAWCIAETGQ